MSPAERAARERLQEAITDRNQKLEAQEAAEVAVGRAVRLRDIAQADLDDALTARNRSALASARMVIEPVLGRDDSPEVTPLPVHVAQEQLDATNEALRVLTEKATAPGPRPLQQKRTSSGKRLTSSMLRSMNSRRSWSCARRM
jgi:hypothetical protein